MQVVKYHISLNNDNSVTMYIMQVNNYVQYMYHACIKTMIVVNLLTYWYGTLLAINSYKAVAGVEVFLFTTSFLFTKSEKQNIVQY